MARATAILDQRRSERHEHEGLELEGPGQRAEIGVRAPILQSCKVLTERHARTTSLSCSDDGAYPPVPVALLQPRVESAMNSGFGFITPTVQAGHGITRRHHCRQYP